MTTNNTTRAEAAAQGHFMPKQKNIITTSKNTIENKSAQDSLKKSLEVQSRERTVSTSRAVSRTYSNPTIDQIETIEEGPKRAVKKRVPAKRKYTRRKTTTRRATSTRKTAAKKITRRSTAKKDIKFIPPKVTLKATGYELIITEKPQAALKIASALGDATQKTNGKVPYYEVNRNGKKLIVACAVGHLFTLRQNEAGSTVPIFDISWVPNYLARKKDFTKRYYDTLLKLAKGAREITVATDYDNEGEVIGMNVVKFICGQKDAARMKFSTLTKDELNEAYEKKSKTINWGQAIAGETRHYLDWYYGINLSRALMNAVKTTGKFKIMSIGRVQGPTLKLIVDKEKEIEAFKPVPFWQVFIKVKQERIKLELKHPKDIFDEKDLSEFDNLVGKTAIATTKKTKQTITPNPPFNLTDLQKEAYKLYGMTPSRTLQVAQGLYLAGLISYPRTSSQKLPKALGYDKILKKIARKFGAEKLIKRKTPIEGKKEDPAHPSIHPTGNFARLTDQDEKIYNLIAKRFIALFCDNALIDKKRIKAVVEKLDFTANGQQIVQRGWMDIYPTQTKEVDIPDLEGEVEITNQREEKKETQPPKRFSPASILTQLEKRNLGTKATRASILETLYKRGYIKEKSIEATPLGLSLIETLGKHSPVIIDEKLTKELQDKTDEIVESKNKFTEQEESVLTQARSTIQNIAKDFTKAEKEIGKELMNAEVKVRAKQKIDNQLCACPNCDKGQLAITYSPKFRTFFIACNAYPDCKTTFSLPKGTIKKTGKLCEHCGFPTLMRVMAGKRPWTFCFNKNCESNKERLEEARARYAKKE